MCGFYLESMRFVRESKWNININYFHNFRKHCIWITSYPGMDLMITRVSTEGSRCQPRLIQNFELNKLIKQTHELHNM